MKMFFRRLSIAVLSLLPCLAIGQTAVWKVSPNNGYSSISLLGNGLYKVNKGNNLGIIRGDGTIVVPVVASEITGFYEGKALVLHREDNRNRIMGYMTTDGRYVAFDKPFYAIDGLRFFSESMLPVSDGKGRLGYVDVSGKPVLGFNGKYDEVHPFTEGMAVVYIEDEAELIDKSGNEATILTGGEIDGVTNLYHGQAYVSDAYEDNVFYLWNKNQSSDCKKVKAPKSEVLDYLFCFSEITGRSATVPYEKLEVPRPDFSPVSSNGKYGFESGGRTILPFQFESASPVVNGLSVVSQNGQYGILQILSQEPGFTAKAPTEPFRYYYGKSTECCFFLTVPAPWQSQPLQISAKDKKTGEVLRLTSNEQNKYSFTIFPTDSQRDYIVSARTESLELWEGPVTISFLKRQVDLQTSIEIAGLQSNTAKADIDDKVIVRAIVKNPGSEEVSAVVTMSGSEAFKTKRETVRIPAGGTVVVESYFEVKQNLEDQYVKVKTDNGVESNQFSLRLRTVDDMSD